MPPVDPGPDANALVRVRGLTKAYRVSASARRTARGLHGRELPAAVPAVVDLDLTVRRGEVYGVLGPNGAGKTTLMKVLGTILLPDAGEVTFMGRDLVHDAQPLRSHIGIVLGEYERTFHWRLTGRQNLAFFAAFHAIPKGVVDERIEHVLAQVGLQDAGDTRFDAYSTGMKHRLALARGLLPDPDLLLLDEPTAGLDAASSEQVARVVHEARTAGKAVIYTTHRLHEAGMLCDRILVLDRGRKVAEASPGELATLAKGRQVVEARGRGAPWPRTLVEPIEALEGVRDWETRGTRLLFYTENDDDVVRSVVDALRKHAPEGTAVTVRPPDVEDAFHELTARQGDTDAATAAEAAP